MAKIYLDSGDNFTLSSAASVFGSTGTEKVVVNSGVTGVDINANVERVDLAGASSAYTYQQVGNSLKVYSGTTLVATVSPQDDTDGTQLVFTNGSVSLKISTAGITLGGATVPSAAAAAVTPTTIDAAVTSGSGSSTGSSNGTYTVTSDVDTVVEGKTATFTVTRSGDVTAAKTLTFNASGDTNNTTVAAAAAGVDASPASGTVTFAAGATTATFTVSAAADTAVEGLEGLRVRLFDGTTAVADKVVLINDDTSSTTVPGTTYTLTTGVDNVVGTAGNDTITADNTGASKQLSVADTINGGAGTDTLKLYQAAADKIASVPTLLNGVSSVEKIYVNNGALTTAETLDISTLSAITSLTIDSAAAMANSETFTIKTSTAQAVGLTKIAGTASGATSTINLNGTTDLTLNNVGTDLTIDNTSTTNTTLKITATGSTASSITLANTGAKVTSLTLAGDTKAATIATAAAFTGLKTVDATGAAAGVNLDTSAGTANALLAFTGGAGNDTLTMAAGATVKTQVLDGGAGTDSLAIKDVTIDSTTTALNQGINAVKNFEVLSLVGGATTAVDVSQVTSIAKFSVDAAVTGAATTTATAVTVSGQTTQSVQATADITAGSAATNTDGNTALKITAKTDSGSNSVELSLAGVTITGTALNGTGTTDGSAVDATNYESVTIHSNNNAAGTATANTLTAGGTTAAAGKAVGGLLLGANATLTVDGSVALVLGSVVSNPGQALNNNLTLNASALTGDLTVVTGAGNDIITGGSGKNNITLSGGVDTVNLSASVAKQDTIKVASYTGLASTGLEITKFTNAAGGTGDKLDITSTTVVGTGTATVNSGTTAVTATINSSGIVSFSNAGSAASFADYSKAVFAAMNTTGKIAIFEFGGDTYVADDIGTAGSYTAGTDAIIKLVGVTGVTGVSTVDSAATTIFVA